MRLISGPAGSGKTTSVLNQFREALRAGNDSIRLLVPTATLEQHLQNQFAREGFVFRRNLIQTLSHFVRPWVADMPEVSAATLYLIVEECARRLRRPEFAAVVDLPGFCASLARTIGEFSSAGCDSARLASCSAEPPLGPAFLAVYREVDRELQRRNLWLRAQRLERAAELIEAGGAGAISTVLMDGFHALPEPEMKLVRALEKHVEVALTRTDFQETPAHRATLMLARAPSIEREVDEIARGILEQAAAGRPFREIGVIVRSADTYVPILRSTLERFGIPARFYFDARLEEHAAIRYLTGVVDAMLGGWNHAAVLGILRLSPRFADSATLDYFDFKVREQIPNSGIDSVRALGETAERVVGQIDRIAGIEAWRELSLTPEEWVSRFTTLRSLFQPSTLTRPDHTLAQIWRSQSAALDAFDEALGEAGAALDREREIGIEGFWRAVRAVLRLKPLRASDDRRNVVHVLSAPEARQWVLPVVFICGMVEKQFPQFHRQDPFFSDAARMRLNAAGIAVRTAGEFEREERMLFETALSRATMLATLSYPEFDGRGDRNLPSLFLEDLLLAPQDARAVQPAPRHASPPKHPAEIRAPALLRSLRDRERPFSASSLESYLQCPFQYFGRYLLRLHAPPARPEERLDFLTQGTIVHEILEKWWSGGAEIGALFDETFARYCAEMRIVRGYHTERLRNQMLENLVAFSRMQQRDPASRTEQKFDFELQEGIRIAGKIDRIDIDAGQRASVTDYKYSNQVSKRRDDPNLLQAPLYVLAAERFFGLNPVRMEYVSLKGEFLVVDWPVPFPDGIFENAMAKSLRAVEQIRGGRIAPEPFDTGKCRYCDFRDVCRVEARETAGAAEGA